MARVRALRAAAAVWFAAGAAPLVAQQDDAPAPIADNSFLIEEAFNQERGVVQHISTFARPDGGGAWAYSFTQEWPFHGMRNQLSYTVPVQHDEAEGTGVGDIGLNYRYQLVGLDGGSIYVAPRATLLLPTGDERRGRGAGGVGFQANLPVSILPAPQIALHANAGATWTPSAKGPLGAESGTLDANAGGSAIWLVRPSFNLLVELAVVQHRERRGTGHRGPAGHLAPRTRACGGHSTSRAGFRLCRGSPTRSIWGMATAGTGCFST